MKDQKQQKTQASLGNKRKYDDRNYCKNEMYNM